MIVVFVLTKNISWLILKCLQLKSFSMLEIPKKNDKKKKRLSVGNVEGIIVHERK